MMEHSVILCLLVVSWWAVVEGRRTPAPGRCTYAKVYNMAGADCSAINLVSIPTLSKHIEVLDASVNRIRVLKNNSLSGLSYLRYLYLADNPISVIEPGAFLEVPELEVLDLSLNSLRSLPYHMPPKLRKLYLAENPLMEVKIVALGESTGLQFLTLADCFLSEMPQLGVLPNLQELNLTGNSIRSLNVSTLANFCNLQVLYVPEMLNDPTYTTTCDCLKVRSWATEHMITFKPALFNCTIEESECEMNSTEEAEAFASCQIVYQAQVAPTHYFILLIASIAFLCFASVLTLIWTRRKKPDKSQETANGRQSKLLPDGQTKPRF